MTLELSTDSAATVGEALIILTVTANNLGYSSVAGLVKSRSGEHLVGTSEEGKFVRDLLFGMAPNELMAKYPGLLEWAAGLAEAISELLQ